jgi:AcrR family transcriptional regulator
MTEIEKQTEDKIFEAATEVFEEKGMDGARMQEIAGRAGINKALLHYYFRTKDLLFEAVFQKLAGRMFAKFEPLFTENMTLEEKIKFFFREHIEFMKQNPRLPAFVLNEIHRNPARIGRLLDNVDFNRFYDMIEKQHGAELKQYNITRESLPQIMTSIAAISVFPFVAKNVLEPIFKKVGVSFESYIEERKEFAPDFIMGALKSRNKNSNIK